MITCLAFTGNRTGRSTFNHGGAGWLAIGAEAVIRRKEPCVAPTDDAPDFMANVGALRAVSLARTPAVSDASVAIGAHRIARAYFDLVTAAWPGAVWMAPSRPKTPVLAIHGRDVVALVAPEAP